MRYIRTQQTIKIVIAVHAMIATIYMQIVNCHFATLFYQLQKCLNYLYMTSELLFLFEAIGNIRNVVLFVILFQQLVIFT